MFIPIIDYYRVNILHSYQFAAFLSSQSRPHEAAPPPPVDTREKRDERDYRDSSRESTLRESKEMRDGRERDREGVRERERDREIRDRDRASRDFNSREKRIRNSKPDVPVVPMADHRPGEEKQRPRSSQELKHPRSVALSGVVLPLLSEVPLIMFTKR